MDAFYAAVEVRDDLTLRGKPLIIGHPGRRGVVSTCSYEARRFGVRSAMPSVVAGKLCPNAVWKRGRMSVYVRESRRIRALLDGDRERLDGGAKWPVSQSSRRRTMPASATSASPRPAALPET